MDTKESIMEGYYQKHTFASSAYEMAGLIRKRFPNIQHSQVKECIAFIRDKNQDVKLKSRLNNAKDWGYRVDAILMEFFLVMKEEFSKEFKGMKFQPVIA